MGTVTFATSGKDAASMSAGRPATLGGVLDAAAAIDERRVFLHCGGRDVTVGELRAASLRVAGALGGLGIGRGDRVAIMMGNVPEFIDIWFGIARTGAIEVPVHSAYRGPLLEHILAESGARILFCDAGFLPRLRGLALPALERIVVREDAGAAGELDPAQAPPGIRLRGLQDMLAEAEAASAREPAVVLTGEDVSCLLYTSGTTGPSKGVVLTHSANLHLARSNVELMEYTADDVLYTPFPLFHVNAKFTSVVATLLCGGRLVLDERLSASRFWERMREQQVTAFNYMGSMLTMIAKQPPRAGDRDHRVQRAYGGACPPVLWEPFEQRFGVRLHEHYGMTETGITTQNSRTVRRVGSIGRAAPGFEVRVADESDREVAVGEVGEIQVRPRLPGIVLREYWQRPEATIAALRNLWFHTGDRARMDADGFFHYVDRQKDSIRRRGENISSFELESVVNEFSQVADSAAYGVPSELGEDEVMVAVVLDPAAGPLDVAGLVAHCRERVAGFAVPRWLRVVDDLPRTASQRVQKYVLREQGITADAIDCDAATRS
jgi:crotonobetaine/carnitine-CoA ligase